MSKSPKGGKDHPNYKHGKYVGAKKKARADIPKTGTLWEARKWVYNNVPIGEAFEVTLLLDALYPMHTNLQVHAAIQNMIRSKELKTLSRGIKERIGRIKGGPKVMTAEHKLKLADAHTGQTHAEETKAAIGAGVRKGDTNKVPFGTRIDAELLKKLKLLSKRRKKPMAQMVEEWISSLS